MPERDLKNGIFQELDVVVESDPGGLTRLDERLVGERGYNALNRRIKIQSEDDEQSREEERVAETFFAQASPKRGRAMA